jgi:hypothetical protein
LKTVKAFVALCERSQLPVIEVPEETVVLLSNRFGARIDADRCLRLHEITEGWPLGLQMAIAAIEKCADLEAAIERLSACSGDIQRYVVDSLVARLRADVHYLDTTGEQAPILLLQEPFGREFAKAGLALVPSMSYMYAVSEITARHCLETQGVDLLEMHAVAAAVPTVASAQTILDAVRYPSYHLKDNQLVKYDGIEVSDLCTPGGQVLKATQWGGLEPDLVCERWSCTQLQNERGQVEPRALQEAARTSARLQGAIAVDPGGATAAGAGPDGLGHHAFHAAMRSAPGAPRDPLVSRHWQPRCSEIDDLQHRWLFQAWLFHAYGAARLSRETPRVTGFGSPTEVFGHRELLGALESGLAPIKPDTGTPLS